ncbi:hypothetical protein ACEUAI_13455 [Aeromonas veronii]
MNNSLITTSAIAMVSPPAQQKLFSARLESLQSLKVDSTSTILSRRLFSYDCFFEKAPSLKGPALNFLKGAIVAYMKSDYFQPSCDGIYCSEMLSLSKSQHLDENDKKTLQSIFLISISESSLSHRQAYREIMYTEVMASYLRNSCITEYDVHDFVYTILKTIQKTPLDVGSAPAESQHKYVCELLKILRNKIESTGEMSMAKVIAYNDAIIRFVENQNHLVNLLDSWLIGADEQCIQSPAALSRSCLQHAARALSDALSELQIHSKELDRIHTLLMNTVDVVSIDQEALLLSLIELAKRLAAREEELESGESIPEMATHDAIKSSNIGVAVNNIASFIDEYFNLHTPSEDVMFNVVKCTIDDEYLCSCSMTYMSITSTVFDSGKVGVGVIKRLLSEGILSPYFTRVIDDKHLSLNCSENDVYSALEMLFLIDFGNHGARRKVFGVSLIERLMTQFYYPAILNGESIVQERLNKTISAAIEFKMLEVDDIKLIARYGLSKIINGIGPAFYDGLMMQSPIFVEAVSSLLLSERTNDFAAASLMKRKTLTI